MDGIGRAERTFRTKEAGAGENAENNDSGGDEILADRFWKEWHAVIFNDRGVFLVVGFAADDHARLRIFVDAFVEHHAQVEAHERKDRAREDEDVERKKP